VRLGTRAERPLQLKDTVDATATLCIQNTSIELFGVRGSQQVEETAADSLVFLHITFKPHSRFCLYRRSLAPCVIDQGVLVLLDRHLALHLSSLA
jgi:hypothetical protein